MLMHRFRRGPIPDSCKEYMQDYVHTTCEPSGELVFPAPPGPAKALVAPGDRVLAGQPLWECGGQVRIHSSGSGTVKALERRPALPCERLCLVIENDRRFQTAPGVGKRTDWLELSRGALLERVLSAGVTDMTPGRFPTAFRLGELGPEDVSRIAVDGTDWEPFVTCETDLMRTRGHGLAEGLRILLRLFPGAEGSMLIGEDNAKARAAMAEASAGFPGLLLTVVPSGTDPGNENLVRRLLGGAADGSACLVMSAAAVYAVYEAVCLSTPVFRRIVTVAGTAVKTPGNYLVRTGTACSELLSAAGGIRSGASLRRAVLGGALTGTALDTLDVPVQKDTEALLLFAEDAPGETGAGTECIRCGLCADACPKGLMPMLMARAAEECALTRYEKQLHGRECLHCGACTWICPARRPLADLFRYAGGLLGAGKR